MGNFTTPAAGKINASDPAAQININPVNFILAFLWKTPSRWVPNSRIGSEIT
jgi:hypothetical protein